MLTPGLLPTPLHNGACLVIRRKHKEKREEALKDEAGMKITLSSVEMKGPRWVEGDFTSPDPGPPQGSVLAVLKLLSILTKNFCGFGFSLKAHVSV